MVSEHCPLPPERPEPSDAVMDWLEERFPNKLFLLDEIEALRGDMPDDVRAWLNAWQQWLTENVAWRKQQPLDFDRETPRWRMFGGRWLSWRSRGRAQNLTYPVGMVDGAELFECYTVAFVERMRQMIAAGVPLDDLKRVAGAIYDWYAQQERIDRDLAEVLRATESPK